MNENQISKAVRCAFRDSAMAFPFRMGAGFAGDVNRTHPVEIEAALIGGTTAFGRFGNVGVIDTVAANNGVRGINATDQSDATDLVPFGLLVRPFPYQTPAGGAMTLGAATPPTSGIADMCRNGLIMVQLNTGVAAPVKGGRVYVWAAATSGDHAIGGFETALSSGNTVRLDARYTYNGPADANGIVEISANV